MSLHKNLHWLIYLLFTLSCARQTSPTGGPKDTIPPTWINSIPKHGEVNVNTKTIELTFSEAVAVNNPKEQLIITPTMGKEFDIISKKDRVVITFDENFKDSTTYTFNFREAVQDITEKNSVRKLKLAFSTGEYIDSLSIEGYVYDQLTLEPIENVTVAIHPPNDTISILKDKAVYFTLTDKAGYFLLDYLKPGVYHLYAFKDQNKNLVADSRSEMYGFLKDTIQLHGNIKNANLGMVKLDARPLRLTSARPLNTYYNIRHSKNIRGAKITSAEIKTLYYSYGTDQSNIQLYNSFPDKDSVLIRLNSWDSIDHTIDTTLYAKFNKRELTPEKFEMQLTSTSLLADKGILKAEIKFSKPIANINLDSLFFTVDTLNVIKFQTQDLTFDSLRNVLFITKTVDKKLFAKPEETKSLSKPQQQQPSPTPNDSTATNPAKPADPKPQKKIPSNELYIGKAAFISIEQDSSRKITQNVNPQRLEDLGMIILQIQKTPDSLKTTPSAAPQTRTRSKKPVEKPKAYRDLASRNSTSTNTFLVQLLDKDYKVVQSARNKNKISFEDLEPASYYIRLVIDTNNNGLWDPGNYLKKEEPEKIIYYKNEKNEKEIKLKANFEIGPLLISY